MDPYRTIPQCEQCGSEDNAKARKFSPYEPIEQGTVLCQTCYLDFVDYYRPNRRHP